MWTFFKYNIRRLVRVSADVQRNIIALKTMGSADRTFTVKPDFNISRKGHLKTGYLFHIPKWQAGRK